VMIRQGAKVKRQQAAGRTMRGKSESEKDVSLKPRPRSHAVAVAFGFLPFAFLLLPFYFTVAAHEPITTKVRFNKEVIRVLQRSCLGCHHAGGIAMSLATYEEARPWAKAIKEEMLEKRMPPWHAVKGYGEFRNAPSLTQREIDLIVNWVEGGAPKGDDKDLPAGPLFFSDWSLGKPDLILKPDAETKVAPDADEHRILILPTKLKEDRWITALDLQPGNGSVVHCATFYLLKDEGDMAREPLREAQAKDEKTQDSLSSSFILHPSSLTLATWMPGQKTIALPEGVAQLMPAGSRIAVRIHYRGAGEESKDLSAVGLYFAKTTPRRQLQEIGITNSEAVIPASAALHRITTGFTIKDDAEAFAIRPRAHPLMMSLQATLYRPDGTQEVLIWARGYQFDWQPTYYFKQPVSLPKGTQVEVIAYFDNSDDNRNNPNDPAKAVRWSEISSEPICALLIANGRASND
jgi:mono/diheme cytochrome c family protein